MPSVRLFNSDCPREHFFKGEVSLGKIWNGEAWMAQQENLARRNVYPKEGASFWVDSFVTSSRPKTWHSKTAYPDIFSIAAGKFQTDVGDTLPIHQKYWEMLRSAN